MTGIGALAAKHRDELAPLELIEFQASVAAYRIGEGCAADFRPGVCQRRFGNFPQNLRRPTAPRQPSDFCPYPTRLAARRANKQQTNSAAI